MGSSAWSLLPRILSPRDQEPPSLLTLNARMQDPQGSALTSSGCSPGSGSCWARAYKPGCHQGLALREVNTTSCGEPGEGALPSASLWGVLGRLFAQGCLMFQEMLPVSPEVSSFSLLSAILAQPKYLLKQPEAAPGQELKGNYHCRCPAVPSHAACNFTLMAALQV